MFVSFVILLIHRIAIAFTFILACETDGFDIGRDEQKFMGQDISPLYLQT